MNVFESPKTFELIDVFSWGVKNDKYKNFSLSVKPDDNTITDIQKIVKEHDAKDPFYNDTLYLKIKNLSEKQRKELLDCGRCRVKVAFEITSVFTNSNSKINHLVFKVKRLGKVLQVEDLPPEDW